MITLERPTRAEWLEQRRKGIGGSDVAQILGVSPWGGPWDVWHSKKYEPVVEVSNEAMDRGNLWESFVIRQSGQLGGYTPTMDPGLIIHPDREWHRGTPDALVGDDGGVEAKTSRSADGWADDGAEIPHWSALAATQVPAHYALQAYWYLELTGRAWFDLAVAIPDYRGDFPRVRRIRIHADVKVQTMLVSRVGEWWDRHIVNGESPPLDATAGCVRGLTEAFPGDPNKVKRAATPEEVELISLYRTGKQAIASIKAELDDVGTRLRAAFGDDYQLNLEDKQKAILTLASGRESVALKRVRKERPELAAELEKAGLITRSAPTRSLRFYGF